MPVGGSLLVQVSCGRCRTVRRMMTMILMMIGSFAVVSCCCCRRGAAGNPRPGSHRTYHHQKQYATADTIRYYCWWFRATWLTAHRCVRGLGTLCVPPRVRWRWRPPLNDDARPSPRRRGLARHRSTTLYGRRNLVVEVRAAPPDRYYTLRAHPVYTARATTATKLPLCVRYVYDVTY